MYPLWQPDSSIYAVSGSAYDFWIGSSFDFWIAYAIGCDAFWKGFVSSGTDFVGPSVWTGTSFFCGTGSVACEMGSAACAMGSDACFSLVSDLSHQNPAAVQLLDFAREVSQQQHLRQQRTPLLGLLQEELLAAVLEQLASALEAVAAAPDRPLLLVAEED
jgi:hypothetical protein